MTIVLRGKKNQTSERWSDFFLFKQEDYCPLRGQIASSNVIRSK